MTNFDKKGDVDYKTFEDHEVFRFTYAKDEHVPSAGCGSKVRRTQLGEYRANHINNLHISSHDRLRCPRRVRQNKLI